jgi:hypothetical protein
MRFFKNKEVMMKSIFLVVFMTFFLFAGCATNGTSQSPSVAKTKFTKHFDDSLFKITEKELFSVEIVTDKKEFKIDKTAAGIIIHDRKDRDVENADIKVILWISKNGQGSEETMKVGEKGNGLYVIEKFNLLMGGNWQLRVKIKKGAIEDSVTFHFNNK